MRQGRFYGYLVLLSAVLLLSGCLSPRWAAPINPLKNDVGDRAQAAVDAKDYVMALEFYGEMAAKNPGDMEVQYRLAQVNQAVERYEEAYRLYRVVYVSGNEDTAPLMDGHDSDEPLYKAAEKQLRLLRARLGKDSGGTP